MLYDLYIMFSNLGSVKICGDLNSRTSVESDCPETYAHNEMCDNDEPDIVASTYEADLTLPNRCSQDSIVNTQGKLLLDFCKSTGLRIVNGRLSDDKHLGKFTFHRLMKKGETKMARSTIDYLLVPSSCFKDILFFNIDDKVPESDHCSLSFMFKICVTPILECTDTCEYTTYSKYKWDGSKTDESLRNLFDQQGITFLNCFKDSIRELQPSNLVAELFNNYIAQAADRCLVKTKGNKKKSPIPQNDWYDVECKKARKMIKEAKSNKAESNNILHLECDYNRLFQRKKRNSKLQKSSELMHTNNSTDMWKKLKNMEKKAEGEPALSLQDFYDHFSKPAVQNHDNVLNFDLTFEKEILDFMNTYREKSDTYLYPPKENSELITDLLNSAITEEEVFYALDSLEKGKSPGLDGIPIDIFKVCKKELCPFIVQ